MTPAPQWLKDWARGRKGKPQNTKTSLQQLGSAKPAYLLDAPQAAAGLTQRALDSNRPNWSPAEETRVRELLWKLDADPYDAWVEAGMILHGLQWDRPDGSIGLEIYHDWSATSNKYVHDAVEQKWVSFGKNTGNYTVGMGTLVLRAREADAKRVAANGTAPEPAASAQPVVLNSVSNGVHYAMPARLTDNPITFLDLDRFNKPKPTCYNTRLAIRAIGIECRYDVFHERMTAGGQRIDQWAGEVSDHVVHMVRSVIREHVYCKFDPGQQNAHDAIVQECLSNQYDPILSYLDSLRWDGVPRLDTWTTRYLGAVESPLNSIIGRLALCAAVRRQEEPGAKFDQIVVMEGTEGTGKSTAIAILAGEDNFSDQAILTLDERAQQEALQGVWLYEIADLVGMSRAEVEKVKAFASRQRDRARPAYGRHRVDRPRRCVFFATTNEQTYLQSQTGDRRFWPIKTGEHDLDALARDRDQLWAEAVEVEAGLASGTRGLILPKELWGSMREIQETRRERDPWDAIIIDLESDPLVLNKEKTEYRITTRDLYESKLRMSPDRQTVATAKRLAHAMRRNGWKGPFVIREDKKNSATGEMESKTFRGYTKGVT